MPALTAAAFPLFFNTTRPSRLTSADTILNLARRTNYPLFMLIRGQKKTFIARGGQAIIEMVKATDTGTFGSFNPGSNASINIVNTSKTMTYQWRFYRSHVGWTDTEYNLHTSGGDFVQVKSFRDAKDQDAVSEHVSGLDSLMFARPDYNRMEAAPAGSGGDTASAYSVMAWISEDGTRFLPPSTAWGTNLLAQTDPTVNAWWRNQLVTYDHTDKAGAGGIVGAFDKMELKLLFRPVPMVDEKKMQSTAAADLVIYTNTDGYTSIQGLYRNAQDRWAKATDAAMPYVTFDDIPFIHAPQLDTELLEQTTGASAAYSGTAYVTGKPRFIWVNKTTLAPVFLNGDIIKPEPVMRGPVNQPDINVVWTQTTGNIVCNARNRNGIVAPAVGGP